MQEIRSTCLKCMQENSFYIRQDDFNVFRCTACGQILFQIKSVQGFIYLLSNEQMPGLLKIGCTSRDVAARVAELNAATGVPSPFQIEAYFATMSPFEDESAIHAELASLRLASSKEFFKSTPAYAVEAVTRILRRPPVFYFSSPIVPPELTFDADAFARRLDYHDRENLKLALRECPPDVLLRCELCFSNVRARNFLRHIDSCQISPTPRKEF